MNMIKKLMLLALAIPSLAVASSGVHLDKAPYDLNDKASLQRGAATFVNYCLNCHSASYMRYNRMKDFGLTDDQIKANLLFAADKVGETMTVAMRQPEAKVWFGAAPPDLTVIARSRGADWLYSYLRGFYRDDTRATGWNNTVFDKVGMPHVLYQLQGEQVMKTEKQGDHETHTLTLAKPGSMTAPEYDASVADLVNYLVYMGDPAQQTRKTLGIIVLLFLGIFLVIAYYLKKEFWKDIH
ncbi:MAG: cytochrome c1 [Sulfuricellaceae bacterium]|nr:cytochrome c1 [Sulfuricellaceae bacterium]